MKWFEQINESSFPASDERDKALFRILPFDALLQMLNEKENTLVRTSMWEDVYENFIFKEEIIFKGKAHSVESLASRCYGQCWTTKMSSDALWRIYSPDKKSVRIKTTIGRLWDSILPEKGGGQFSLGKVQYFSQTQIRNDLIDSSPFKLEDIGNLVVSSFFAKRSSFSHESEYRLIFFSNEGNDDKGKMVKTIKLDDPLSFIINIYFDPRAEKAYVDRCTTILVKAFGYPANRIYKSSLYDFKPCTIEIR